MKQCPFCPCQFEANSDFNMHMETFGWNKEAHQKKYYRIHKEIDEGFYTHEEYT